MDVFVGVVRRFRHLLLVMRRKVFRRPLLGLCFYVGCTKIQHLSPEKNVMVKLTPRQQEILDFIRSSTVESEGRPPTRAEVCTAFGFRSPNAAETHLRALAAKGAILLEEGRARGIRLAEALGLPLVGRVAAGSPILAAEHC